MSLLRLPPEPWLDRRPGVVAAALGAALVALAWMHRFVQDDAFITFRYARHLADGLGLVWNPGERVEGYTNFLWTVIVAAGMKIGADPVIFSQVAGLLLFSASLFLTWKLAGEAGLAKGNALAALLVTGANFTYSSYATGGLETPLVTSLFLAGLLVAARSLNGSIARERALLALSALATAGVMTRMDTALLLAGPCLAALVGTRRRALFAGLTLLCAIPVTIIGVWLAWKWSYYGDLFPRSFYLRALDAASLERGLRYFYEFAASYLLAPFVFLALFRFGELFRPAHRVPLLLAGSTVLWCAYVLKVGGDFMEFRFLVPVVPAMMILAIWMSAGLPRPRWIVGAAVVLLLAGSFRHATTFAYEQATGVEPVSMLEGHLEAPGEDWVGIGKALADAFRNVEGPVVATTAAGAIPYYSNLKSVDMLGLNEPPGAEGEANEGEPEAVAVSSIPGHRRVYTYEYLRKRGVNLVVSHPIVLREGEPPPALPLLPTSGHPHLDAKLLAMPVGGGYRVLMLYVRPHPAVDSAVARGGWEVRPVAF